MKLSRSAKRLGGGAVVFFVALQFVRPSLPNPPVTAEIDAPASVASILRASCYDCHSNETKLRWFDEIVPAYWLVAKDVRDGRAHLDFSTNGAHPAGAQRAALFESLNQARLGAMPPAQYLLLHPEAKIDAAKIAVWEAALKESKPITSTVDVTLESTKPHGDVAPASNGVTFPADYLEWKLVSATNRFDNHTVRLILGNEVTMRAIAEKRIRPWPDGAAFVKIAWAAGEGESASRGELVQIETMIKDARAHAATEGWGFARWKGTAFVPYGNDASFVDECTGCHAPVRDDDFVYTMALGEGDGSDAWNAEARWPASLPSDPTSGRVVGASFDRGADTVAVTFDLGATRRSVTWSTQEDRHWFGGRILAAPRASE